MCDSTKGLKNVHWNLQDFVILTFLDEFVKFVKKFAYSERKENKSFFIFIA